MPLSYKIRLFLFSLIACFAINSLPCYAYSPSTETHDAYFEPERPKEESIEEMYKDVFMTMLLPYIQKAVDSYIVIMKKTRDILHQ